MGGIAKHINSTGFASPGKIHPRDAGQGLRCVVLGGSEEVAGGLGELGRWRHWTSESAGGRPVRSAISSRPHRVSSSKRPREVDWVAAYALPSMAVKSGLFQMRAAESAA